MGSSGGVEAFLRHEFSHVVIGGGTAGLVVAARLSENPALTVGIIEAGPVALDEPTINVPGRLGETLFTKYDWQFKTTPQPGLNGRKLPWNRGKVLGGSSALNFMMWTRGSREDYDAWEELGNKGWGWDGMLSVCITLCCVFFLQVSTCNEAPFINFSDFVFSSFSMNEMACDVVFDVCLNKLTITVAPFSRKVNAFMLQAKSTKLNTKRTTTFRPTALMDPFILSILKSMEPRTGTGTLP